MAHDANKDAGAGVRSSDDEWIADEAFRLAAENERLRAVIAELLEADSLLATVPSEYYPDANRRWDEAVSAAKAALEDPLQVTPSPESDPA